MITISSTVITYCWLGPFADIYCHKTDVSLIQARRAAASVRSF